MLALFKFISPFQEARAPLCRISSCVFSSGVNTMTSESSAVPQERTESSVPVSDP